MTDMRKVCDLPNGYELLVRDDEVGGREYWSTEVGGICVWQGSLVDESTLLAAITEEHRARIADYHAAEKARSKTGP